MHQNGLLVLGTPINSESPLLRNAAIQPRSPSHIGSQIDLSSQESKVNSRHTPAKTTQLPSSQS